VLVTLVGIKNISVIQDDGDECLCNVGPKRSGALEHCASRKPSSSSPAAALDIQTNPQGKERPIQQRRSPAAFSGSGRWAFSRPWVLEETEAAAGVGADGGVPAKGLASAGCVAVGFGQLRRRCRITSAAYKSSSAAAESTSAGAGSSSATSKLSSASTSPPTAAPCRFPCMVAHPRPLAREAVRCARAYLATLMNSVGTTRTRST